MDYSSWGHKESDTTERLILYALRQWVGYVGGLPRQENLFCIVLADFLLYECVTFQLKKKVRLFLTNPKGGELGEVSPGMPPAIYIKPSCPAGLHTHPPEPALSF